MSLKTTAMFAGPGHARALARGFVLSVVLTLAFATGAFAQGGRFDFAPPDGMRDAFRADCTSRNLPLFEERLGLLDYQGPILQTFYQDYEDAFSTGIDQLQARLAELRPQRPAEAPDEAAKRLEIQTKVNDLRRDLQARASQIGDPDVVRKMSEEYMRQLEPLYEELKNLNPNVNSREEVDAMMKAMNRELIQWEAQKKSLADQFLNNLQNILTEDQLAKWPSLQRLLRRQKTLPFGRLSGESLDLIALAADRRLDANVVEPILATYEVALDAALRARADDERDHRAMLAEGLRNRDAAAVLPLVDSRIARHVAVRDINEQTLQAMVAALGDDGPSFMNAANLRAFPRIYRATSTQRALNAAIALSNLSDQTRSSLDELRVFYETELARRNAQLRQLTFEFEPVTARFQYESLLATGDADGQQAEDPIRAALDEREAFESQFKEQLRSVLTPEEVNQVPALRATGAAGGGDSVVNRFDTNGDGRLDATERDALRAYYLEHAGHGHD